MLQKNSLWLVASVFFREPTKKKYLLGLSREIGLAHTSVKNHLFVLLEKRVIREEVEIRGSRRFPYYVADTDSSSYSHYKRLYNFDSLYSLVTFLREQCYPNTIILFGSYSRGEDVEKSDIDLYIQASPCSVDMSSFEEELNRTVSLHFSKNFEKYPQELQENIRRGITLYGYLEEKNNTGLRTKK